MALNAKSQNDSLMVTFQVSVVIGETHPAFTWYGIDTKIPSIAHPNCLGLVSVLLQQKIGQYLSTSS